MTSSSAPTSPVLIDAHTHIGADLFFYVQKNHPYAQDWSSLVRLGEANGIGQFVVFPMVSNLALNFEAMVAGKITSEGGLERVPYRFENRRMMTEIFHYFPELSDRAIPLWMIDPSREQQQQVAALRELGTEFNCRGLKIQATVIQSKIRDLLGPGRCLIDFAEEKGLPVLIHTSVHPDDPWSPVADILAVAEAWPGVRFNLAHSCRFDRPTLDRIAELPNAWFDCSAHRIHCQLAVMNSPSVACLERRVPSDYRDPVTVLGDLAERYPTKLLWGSDSPFESYIDRSIQLRSTYRDEADTLHALGAETVIRIAHTNNLAFLNGIA